MFSSPTNTLMSPYPQYYFPSSSSSPYHQPPPQPPPPPPPPPMLITQNDNIFLHQNHPYDPLLSLANAQIPETTLINLGVYNASSTTNILTSTTTTKQDVIISNNAGLDPTFLPKRPVKKDRHSKIYTAQGLRDRRVRLSIDIAREFFDLHDMLGFDKASKTLEWLLAKSKKAIKELSRRKLRAKTTTITTPLSSANSECEQAVSEPPDHVDDALEDDQDMSSATPKSKAALKEKLDTETLSEADLMNLLAKESRAKARARARARTKEKIIRHSYCTSSPNTPTKRPNYNVGKSGSSTQMSDRLGTRSPNSGLNLDHRMAGHGGDNDQEESIVMIRRKNIKFPNSISSGYVDHHHQGQLFCGISRGEASNNVIYSCPSLLLTQNWDNINNNNISTASPQPSFCLPT